MDKEFESHAAKTSSPATLERAYIDLVQNRSLWSDGLDHALKTVVKHCALCMQVSRCSIWQFTEHNKISCAQMYNAELQSYQTGKSLSILDLPIYFNAIKSSRVVDAHDAHRDTRTQELAADYLIPMGITSILDAAINNKGVIEGDVCFEHIGPQRHWSEDEKNFAASAADLVAQLYIYYAMKDNELRYKILFNQCADAVFISRNNTVIDCNETALEMFGCQRHDILGKHPAFYSPPHQADGADSFVKAQHHIHEALSGKHPIYDWLHTRLDGTPFFTRVKLSCVELNGQAHLIGTIHDVDAFHNAEQRIIELNTLQKAIVAGAKYAIISTDTDGIIQSFNPAAEQLLGYQHTEVINRMHVTSLLKKEEVSTRAPNLNAKLSSLSQQDPVTLTQYSDDQEWTYLHKNGTEIPVMLSITVLKDNDRKVVGYLGIAYDLTAWKKTERDLITYQKELEHRANHDSLTGLPNRTQLHEDAKTQIQASESDQQLTSLMLLDLDRFKEINDTLGHHTGDLLLKALATQLQGVLQQYNATLYRLGGDEFAILHSSLNSLQQAYSLAQRLSDCIRQPIEAEGILLELAGSIGIAIYPTHGSNIHELLRCSDVAMYSAKRQSQSFTMYDNSLDSHSPRRLKMMAELGNAIRTNQLTLFFQPRIEVKTGLCVGCEALIRWNHPELGRVPPDEFIHLAEMSETIHALSHWVIEHAIQQIKIWQSVNINIPVAINLSARNLVDLSLPDTIETLLEQNNVESKWLEIEITESAFISDPGRAESVVNDINQLGISMAIDDFGTGYSSLSYLKRLPIQTLKIDRSFVDDMLQDEQDAAIVHSTIGLAHSFGLTVIAEGVENQDTLEALSALNCEHAQGFHICRPIPPDEFIQWFSQSLPTKSSL
ncbi:EAL domain-containing protein [Neptunomonas phycophila]|uniref:EAL domain-containing protein n=1 Tax=Neptunomonas phycophila TaxID=1572645 RepID=A0ABT9EQ07_9GAMM|nr:EAL domain-containing protein [Neptunomonas phycophila]MDP2521145.1 EAL domain-containing protein [Neptunomonas phycophila]